MRLKAVAMKAVYFERFGGPEVVQFGERPTPEPGPKQVLVEVHAAAINPRDWQFRDGTYAFRRLSGRLPIIPGSDVSGVVVARGRRVTDLDIGDEVFAMQTTLGGMGGFAEYISVDAGVVARKPPSVSHVDAAAVPVAGLTAWQALHAMAAIGTGSRVAVIGASGGVGHYAVQFAREAGATVTGICGPDNVDFVAGLGAHRVIDYRQGPYVDALGDQDVIFDTIGRGSLHSHAAGLAPGGRYLTTVPTRRAATEAVRSAVARSSRRAQLVLVRPKRRDLDAIGRLLAQGRVRSVVERVYPLADAGAALQDNRGGHTRGKLVLQVL
jgi:NADPH:quinone reductase-like Zn-dependent oxidoreductase